MIKGLHSVTILVENSLSNPTLDISLRIKNMYSRFNKQVHAIVKIIKRTDFVRSGNLQKCDLFYVGK